MMSAGLLHMEASLDKEVKAWSLPSASRLIYSLMFQMYYHGESIAVNVHLQNNSNKSVKKLKVRVIIFLLTFFTVAVRYVISHV